MQEQVVLECINCKNRNYSTTKNKKTLSGRLELKKYCNFCRRHTLHREIK